MAMHLNFSDWYRSAGLKPDEGLLNKRWLGLENCVKSLNAEQLINYASIFVTPPKANTEFLAGFAEEFRKHDNTFALKDNLQELRVLAGAILRLVIEENHRFATLAALTLECGSFGPRAKALPEADHLISAKKLLIIKAQELRTNPGTPKLSTIKLNAEEYEKRIPATMFAQGQTPQLRDPLIEIIEELASSLKTLQDSTKKIWAYSQRKEEEVNMVWWLLGRFSSDLKQPFSEIGYEAGALIIPKELADLTIFVPGSAAILGAIASTLKASGLPPTIKTLTIAKAVNATPRDWREQLKPDINSKSLEVLCPVLLALRTSMATDGAKQWIPIYSKLNNISVNMEFPVLQISIQLYNELMLVKSVGSVPR